MGKFPRYVPEGSLVEVTTRTLQGRFLLRPSRDLNDIVNGVLAKAAERYDVAVVHFVTMSNHMHLLVVPRDAQALADFMTYVNGKAAGTRLQLRASSGSPAAAGVVWCEGAGGPGAASAPFR